MEKKGHVDFHIMFVTDIIVEYISTEHYPVEKYLSDFATYFMLLTILRDVP